MHIGDEQDVPIRCGVRGRAHDQLGDVARHVRRRSVVDFDIEAVLFVEGGAERLGTFLTGR
jgi:hypothetical protein